ncbi:SpoIVB peptidase [Koleobacter methoxysyntrophicus]|uniref:SpoIVB peptidase n=1 Tax=Koleobacter methoxysyntrophicus TaxID=2751313 RepID=A0A8A0RR80_9FIRM|nr:SpoIVB peptidase [Koleobacter methoxysyntrophicus]MDK2901424.1 stage sporulation protein [Thermosediminibacterales bacterium]QSQ10060.1 SpoIVB peptidase [Koleobacter methoxysyntrophicus]
MKFSKERLRLGFIIVLLILTTIFLSFYDKVLSFPEELKAIEGKERILELQFPFNVSVRSDNGDLLINGNHLKNKYIVVNLSEPVSLKFLQQGTINLELKMLGLIPLKKIKVNVIPEIKVVPGGHSIGVKLRSDGVIVVGYSNIIGPDSKKYSPGRSSGIQLGDTIVEINKEKILGVEHMAEIINETSGSEVELKIKRNSKIFSINVKPIYNKQEGLYQLGLWVRDIAAGVGTLTFYDPENKVYGALGHIITDIDTGKPIEISEGEIIKAKIAAIEKGERNKPGEKKGVFVQEDKIIGNIQKNTSYGIFGILNQELNNPYYHLIPVGIISEVQEGPAEMLTVIKDDKIERFNIEILKVFHQKNPDNKGMIIKITDKRLIDQTGGIVQGMSGSPIIQKGKLVGAVTHVFVNDPTKGYAVFAEWMVGLAKEYNENSNNTVVNF